MSRTTREETYTRIVSLRDSSMTRINLELNDANISNLMLR